MTTHRTVFQGVSPCYILSHFNIFAKCYLNYQNGEFLNGVNGIWLRREDFILATKDVPFIDNLMQLMEKMGKFFLDRPTNLFLHSSSQKFLSLCQ